MKHTTYTASVRCSQCGLGMWQKNANDSETVYICINNHIRKIPRPSHLRPMRNNQPPNDAA